MKKLVIAEKPSVAKDYAKILKCNVKNKGYYEGDNYIVTYSIGHLFSLKEPGEYKQEWKKWKMEDLPIIPEKYNTKLLEKTKVQYFTIKSLVDREDVEVIINGGDCGVEGELIQRWILLNTRTTKPIKRLWINDLTEKEIKRGFNNLKDSKDYDKYFYAANTRSKIDWLIGMNYSRVYTLKAGNNQTLSLGRCQTPVLNLIVQRDIEIKNFKPVPYYEIVADFEVYKGKYISDNKDEGSKIFDKKIAEEISNSIKSKDGVVEEVNKEIKNKRPCQLFNLTDLQKVMASKYGFTEDKTLELAQKLYEEHKILSYPRTSSKYLSENIAEEFSNMIKILEFGSFTKVIENITDESINKIKKDKRFVDNKEITDHFALIPTQNPTMESIYLTLDDDEKILFNEIVLRFLTIFYEDYVYEKTVILTKVNNFNFITKGLVEINKGWKSVYKDSNSDEKEDDDIKSKINEGETYNVDESLLLSSKTKKPPTCNSTSVLGFMEKYNIGTEATRAEIIKTLVGKEYVIRDGVKLISTDLGKDLIKNIDIKEIKSVELTSDLEKKLKGILNGELNHQEVFTEAIEMVRHNVEKVKKSNIIIEKKKDESLGICLKCKKGQILNKGKLYGCSRYEEGCDLAISTKIMGTQISEIQIKKLALKKKSDVLKFTKDGKEIKGYLYYNDKEEKVKIKYK